ncbi:phosphate ABC transporter permease subunit PstC [Streptomyces hoynatensis]|uniref:Phosphate transport system permease protein n=1 Tax=Streptomyces hoynatensis TaxID=1141874 RepID=A0A3A9Z0R1_9ACTN|nr:phosphate ABC transporter permease subunit PstC [Streptomyces hoynatensis]RKN41730.1 phosphate ABC transporter permease subunit PstC [Streptomyces hoynatensis]
MPPTTEKTGTRGAPLRLGDRVFAGASTGAGVLILVILAGVAAFLVSEAWPAVTAPSEEIPGEDNIVLYIWPLLFGTLLSAFLALVIATPLAVAIALFISHYAPRSVATILGYVIDLLAAVPSIIYGLWGAQVLAPQTVDPTQWLEDNLGFIPLFDGPASATGRTMLTVTLVLAVMILPICTAVVREAFLQTPRLHEEASLALGATRWEMIRMSVLPFGRSAIVGGAMLGLGRALGETMAVAMVLSVSGDVTFDLISQANPSTIAANVALSFPESSGTEINVLIASGLVLFIVTLLVNMAARAVINRRRDFSGAN